MARFAIRNITKVLQSASGRLFGRLTAGDGPGEELTPAQVRSLCSVYSVSETNSLLASVAPLLSPVFTGAPAAPTASPGTNTTQLATTAFVTAAVAAVDVSAKVTGPSSATDNALVRFDMTTGKLVQNSVGILSDAGVLSGLTGINVDLGASGHAYFHRGSTEGVTIGDSAGADDTSAVCIGFGCGQSGTSGGQVYSTRMGRHAGFLAEGGNDVILGHAAGQYAGNCSASVIIGYEANRNPNQLATFNSFQAVIIGYLTAKFNSSCSTAVIIGTNAAANTTLGTVDSIASVVIGVNAASASLNHRNSVIIGAQAGQNCSSNNSVYVGAYAGQGTSGSQNVFIGLYAGYQMSAAANCLVIDSNDTYGGTGVNALIYGEFDNRLLRFGADTVRVQKDLILEDDQTPASASATGTTGMVRWDSNYIYVCTATNTWKRVAIATW